jgi:hypothetical protein
VARPVGRTINRVIPRLLNLNHLRSLPRGGEEQSFWSVEIWLSRLVLGFDQIEARSILS